LELADDNEDDKLGLKVDKIKENSAQKKKFMEN